MESLGQPSETRTLTRREASRADRVLADAVPWPRRLFLPLGAGLAPHGRVTVRTMVAFARGPT